MNKCPLSALLLTALLTTCSPPSQEAEPVSQAIASAAQIDPAELARWEQLASSVTISRDKWGIAHIYGKTDADTVFGTLYAQAEDDFNRVETNYINAMGRLAEAEGEAELFRDLRMKLFIDPVDMQAQYKASPEWLQSLMNAFADGLNYYLYTHPEVTPRVIDRFEPWMALTFSEGSIGGDIERVNLRELQRFYGDGTLVAQTESVSDGEPRGSNGFAIAPSNTEHGNALLLINPHTSFFFRSELHMVSEEGLNAYGAVTWGQFFIYQGFNENAGWMHTSSRADAIDEYLETIVQKDDGYYYLFGDEERKLEETEISLPYKNDDDMAAKNFTVYHSHHGPIIRERDGKWVSIKLMQEPIKALTQSYTRTKAQNHEEFYASMELQTNSSNNTVYADSDGNIAYYHGNFIPVRDPSFDWNSPLDGSNPETEWQGLHPIDEIIHLLNPTNGWIQNTNNWPFTAAGEYSPRAEDYPPYMANNAENYRGVHAVRVLKETSDFTIDKLIEAAYDPTLTAFEDLIPGLLLITAVDNQGELQASIQSRTLEYIDLLRNWDYKYSIDSTATTLAVYWGQALMNQVATDASRANINVYKYMANNASIAQKLSSLRNAAEQLETDFGDWRVPWGEINRYQRLSGDIVQDFNDEAVSLPVAFASSRWGSLASFGSRTYPGTKKMYGTSGNSFVAAVEFGDKVTAKAITVGGLNNDPNSPHFDDQAEMYTKGEFRDVLFYREDIEANLEREYTPGN
ncbi:MAG: acylase [SAR86 cluster bacterium]|uniref:Acylase n=1 Tax=SAR86 cluster bacterium TaxID=2030880 RepID=A0A2A4XJL2_9GAMM|nr:MAG: acylase [SAR86 cluster bacterium]